jgi:hypothetical protein
MKKMKKLIITFFTCIFLLNACNELDLFPLSEGSDANWFSDETELEMAVVNVFHQAFWNGYAPINFYYNTDDYCRRVEPVDLLNGTVTGRSSIITSAWNNCYKCIARANFVTSNYEKTENVPEERMNMYAANARFARAVQYSKLVFHWGDVPYYESTIDIEEAFSMGRASKSEILENIYADFDFAIEHLPAEYGSSEYQLATKGAALAFKARIALFMGDYTVARDAAKDCMDLGAYQLFPDYYTLFLAKTKNSIETIFAVPYSIENNIIWSSGDCRDALTRTAGGYCSRSPSWDLFCSYLCTDGLPIDESPLFDPHEPFKNRDPRCAATIVEFGRNWVGFTYTPHPDSLKVLNHNTGKLVTNNDCRTVTPWAAFNGLAWAKHCDETWLDLKTDNDNILMRYADVLLMYAEAKIELNQIDQSVLDAMNQVRARAYGVSLSESSSYPEITTTSQAELRKILRVERRMEFAKEASIRYDDIIRWRLAEKVLNVPRYGMLDPDPLRTKVVNQGLWFFPETPPIDEDGVVDFKPMHDKGLVKLLIARSFDPAKHYLWPIPSNEIVINENMTQNPGY